MVNYQAYLKSEHWQSKRKTVVQICSVCGADIKLDVHHKSYKRLGNERKRDLTALCRTCHTNVHEFIKTNYTGHKFNCVLYNAAEAYKKHLIKLENISRQTYQTALRPLDDTKYIIRRAVVDNGTIEKSGPGLRAPECNALSRQQN